LPLLKAAYDRGINTWDTADVYSNGESEVVIGKALKKYNIPRRKVLILTKCFACIDEDDKTFKNVPEVKTAKDYVNQSGLSRHHILNSVDGSLRRLQTDYIDLFQIHRFDPDTPIEETMQALHDVVRAGKVRYIGASSMWAWQFAMMQACAEKNGWTKFVSMQNQYSLLYREEEREMNKYCNFTGVGLIPWGPLAAGQLARPAKDTKSTVRSKAGQASTGLQNDEITGRVQELAEKKGWKMSQVALTWIAKRVSSPIVGFSSVERMDEALDLKDKALTEDDEKFLEELYKPMAIQGHQ
jgi:aryl-alcohol dehydrogenase-like predicted oxidoreductase